MKKNWRVIVFEDDENNIVESWRVFNKTMQEVREEVVELLGEGDDWQIQEIVEPVARLN